MAHMTDSEAKEIINSLAGEMLADVAALTRRIPELQEDFEKDPWPDTKVQITRLKDRLAKRDGQVTALIIAMEKFGEPVPEAYDMDKAWRFVADSYDGMAYSPTRSEWLDKEILEFVREHHVDGLDAFKR
jgi:hypothetical protein